MEILNKTLLPSFKKGSKIKIKKKNRGKFTEYCGGKVTQECIDKAKKSKNPTLRKRLHLLRTVDHGPRNIFLEEQLI